MGDYFLELALTVTGGCFGDLGRLLFTFWLKGTSYPFLGQGARGVLVRGSPALSASEFEPAPERVRSLVDQLTGLGFPGRKPRVEAVVYTSDCWAGYHLAVQLNRKHDTFVLGVQSSGFRGPDHVSFRNLLRQVFAAGGVTAEDYPYDLWDVPSGA